MNLIKIAVSMKFLIYQQVVPFFVDTEELPEKSQSLTQFWKNSASNEIRDICNSLTISLQNDPALNHLTITVLSGLTKSMKNIKKVF